MQTSPEVQTYAVLIQKPGEPDEKIAALVHTSSNLIDVFERTYSARMVTFTLKDVGNPRIDRFRRHFKGGLYYLKDDDVLNTTTGVRDVLYANAEGKSFSQPYVKFNEVVHRDDYHYIGPRFRLIPTLTMPDDCL